MFIFAVLGIYVVGMSRADNGVVSFEAENTVLSGTAKVVSDSLASSGSAVSFSSGVAEESPSSSAVWGPSGKNWPTRTPKPSDSGLTVVEVDASWISIGNAIKAATATQVNNGMIIKVRPGSLVGLGSNTPYTGTDGTGVLQNVGSASWTKRLLVYPRDGFGSVTLTGSTTFYNIQNIAIGGMKANGLKCVKCNESAFTQLLYTGGFFAYGETGTAAVDDFQLIEVAKLNVEKANGDSMDIFTNGSSFTNLKISNIWLAPRYYDSDRSTWTDTDKNGTIDDDENPHTDTFQMEPTSGGNISGTIENFAMFTSTNSAFQVNGVNGMEFKNGIIYGERFGLPFYPIPSGAVGPLGTGYGFGSAFNGTGANMTATDMTVIGIIRVSTSDDSTPFNTVTNSIIYSKPALSGATWTVDDSLSSTNPKPPTTPTETSLKNLWKF